MVVSLSFQTYKSHKTPVNGSLNTKDVKHNHWHLPFWHFWFNLQIKRSILHTQLLCFLPDGLDTRSITLRLRTGENQASAYTRVWVKTNYTSKYSQFCSLISDVWRMKFLPIGLDHTIDTLDRFQPAIQKAAHRTVSLLAHWDQTLGCALYTQKSNSETRNWNGGKFTIKCKKAEKCLQKIKQLFVCVTKPTNFIIFSSETLVVTSDVS